MYEMQIREAGFGWRFEVISDAGSTWTVVCRGNGDCDPDYETLWRCDCRAGRFGRICRHVKAVWASLDEGTRLRPEEATGLQKSAGRIVMDVEFERRLDAERGRLAGERSNTALVEAGVQQTRKAAFRATRGLPYGFRKDDGKVREDQSELPGLRDILRMRLGGHSYERIAAFLDASGRPTRRGGDWAKQVVRDICMRAVV